MPSSPRGSATRRRHLLLVTVSACSAGPTDGGPHDTQASDTIRETSFRRDVLPVFETHCVTCHGGQTPQADLVLTDPVATGLFEEERVSCTLDDGFVRLPAVIPFDAEASPLVLKLEDEDLEGRCGREMPANGTPLVSTHPDAVAMIRAWIDDGAVVD